MLGAAGVGKTTLASICVEQAVDRGMWVIRTPATQASRQLPFGAMASILPPDPEDGDLSVADQSQLLRRYLEAVVEAAGPRQLLLFIDDAHLLDDGSAILVHQLAVMRAATVLATVRLGEVVSDPVTALWRDGLAERIDLAPLGEASVEELLDKVLGAPMEEGSLRLLMSRCQGNPLFLRELVIGALEAGQLVGDGGIWRIRGEVHPTRNLVDLVTMRLGVLSDSQRDLLGFLALGEPLDHTSLDRLVEPSTVRALERSGLIASQLDGRRIQVRLAHPMYGDVVRIGMSPIREREIARALAEAIEADGGRCAENILRLAVLRLTGGGGSADLLLAGAVASKARHDHVLAERLARAAIEQGAGFEARLIAAWANAHSRTDESNLELAELADQAVSDADRARVALLRFDNAFNLQGEAHFALLYEAIGTISDQFWVDELQNRLAAIKCHIRGPRIALEVGATPFPNATDQRNMAEMFCLARMGRLAEAWAFLPSGCRSISGEDVSKVETGLLLTPAVLLTYEGRLAEAEEFLSRFYLDKADDPSPPLQVIAACALANLLIEQGRPMSALRRAHEAILVAREHGGAFFASWGYAPLARAFALTGQHHKAAEALAVLDALNLPPNLMIAADAPRARGWTAVAEGDLVLARIQFEAAADLGEEVGDLIGAAIALHDLSRIGCARQAAPRLTVLAGQMEGDFVRARAGYTAAVAESDSAELIKVGQRFDDMGAILYAAESFAEASVLLRRDGMARAATAAALKSAKLLARCEGASTPPVQSMTARVRLTPGEFQTASLAATGHSDKEIARTRTVSVRTIQTQLHRVYAKLGVSGRRDLADALQESSSPT
ncbi:MAG: AAA family ATPase [Acidimicrobiales bacterium]